MNAIDEEKYMDAETTWTEAYQSPFEKLVIHADSNRLGKNIQFQVMQGKQHNFDFLYFAFVESDLRKTLFFSFLTSDQLNCC